MALRKNREEKNSLGIEKAVLMPIVRVILWTSKGGIGRWKLDKVGEQIFGGNCRADSMHK